MTPTFLLIPRLRVQGANAQATWWLINPAPVMACTLFGHALGRHLRKSVMGVAILHHTAQLHGEQFGYFYPEQRRGAVLIDKKDYVGDTISLSLQPTASFSGEFSFIIQFDEYAEISVQSVEHFLMRARLAGGQILEHGKPSVFTSESELLHQIRSGFWLIDRRDLMDKAEGEDWLDTLLRVTARKSQPKSSVSPLVDDDSHDDDDDDANNPEDDEDALWLSPDTQKSLPSSWILPTTLGYALLTSAQTRSGAREGHPHAFAEPLVGPVQYVSPRDFGDRRIPVWQHGWPRDDVFLLSQPDLEI